MAYTVPQNNQNPKEIRLKILKYGKDLKNKIRNFREKSYRF